MCVCVHIWVHVCVGARVCTRVWKLEVSPFVFLRGSLAGLDFIHCVGWQASEFREAVSTSSALGLQMHSARLCFLNVVPVTF